MDIGKSKGGKKAIGMAMAAIIVASIFATFTPAFGFHNVPVPSGKAGIYFLDPRHDSADINCISKTIEVWVNTTGNISGGSVLINTTDKLCGNITGCWCNNTAWTQSCACVIGGNGQSARITFMDPAVNTVVNFQNFPVGTITVHCNSSTYCITGLNFTFDKPNTYVSNGSGSFDAVGENGTFTCCPPPETFSKYFVKGWNLISLPLTNMTNMTVANIMSSVSGSYDALYKYDATNNSWVSMNPTDIMENGVGYCIHMTANDTWTYKGTPYTQMNIELEEGLNMIGWLNCSKSISDALSSIAGNYNYVARWNASLQEFEVYVPGAPFNDFNTMEQGKGYFISAKDGCPPLTESCGA